MEEGNTDLALPEVDEDTKQELKEPPKFSVILHNDDYTTMEFVVEILARFFALTKDKALRVMLEVHKKGKALAGVYTFEIAETKISQVHQEAKARGYPLKCTMEPAE
jgi:ATP-dependent Clp protease adaptor protein ClpS